MLLENVIKQLESCVISIIYSTFAYKNRTKVFLIHTMAEEKIDNTLGEVKNIMENKKRRLGLPFAGYSCSYVESNGAARYDSKGVGYEDELFAAVYFQSSKRTGEYVIGNSVQD